MNKKPKNETFAKKAKKKKDFIVIIILVGIVTTIITSFLMTYLDSDRKEAFDDRVKIENKKEFEIIKKQDMKETWAISIENRIEAQNEKRIKAQKKLEEKTEKKLSEIQNLLVDSMASLTSKIEQIDAGVLNKLADIEASSEARFAEQQSQIEDLSLREQTIDDPYEFNQGNIILGPDLLPPEVEAGKKSTVNGNTETANKNLSIDEGLNNIVPEKQSHTEETKEIKEKKIVKKEKTPIIPKRMVLTTVNVDVSSSQEEIKQEEEEYAQLEELRGVQTNSLHIMTGLTQAYMITGAYAPAFESGKEEPLPVLFQVEGDILIANNDTESLDNCMLIGSAKGNMNSQTADIRLHNITCSLADGTKMIEGSISGWVIGENGIPGVQGELMHKNGAWLSKTFVAGFLETFASAFSNTDSTEITFDDEDDDVSPGNAIGDNLKSAGAGGLSTVFGRLGEYYLQMAEQIFPVIEVKGGRTVNILLKGGEDLKIKDFNKVDLSEIEDRIETEKDFIKKVGVKKYKSLKAKLEGEESEDETPPIAEGNGSVQEQDSLSIQDKVKGQLDNILEGRN